MRALRTRLFIAGAVVIFLVLVAAGLSALLRSEHDRALKAEARASAAERALRRASGLPPNGARPDRDHSSSGDPIKSP